MTTSDLSLYDRIAEAAAAVRRRHASTPEVAIILGTGLGRLAEDIAQPVRIPYHEIPHLAASTAESHAGVLVAGTLAGRRVVAFQGRCHLYEGYSAEQVTFPVRLAKALGAHTLVVSNACGGMNPRFARGDLMIMEDHINLLGVNPLIGPNDDRLGPRWPDMCRPYDPALIALAEEVALARGIKTHQGVYVAVTGPNLETRAEYRFLRAIGADVVGMSTVPEVIVAVHAGLRVLGFSIVTDQCFPDALEPAVIADILAAAAAAEPKLAAIVTGVLARL